MNNQLGDLVAKFHAFTDLPGQTPCVRCVAASKYA